MGHGAAQLRTGVAERRIAKDGQTAFDLSVLAVDGLLSSVKLDRHQVQASLCAHQRRISSCLATRSVARPLNLKQECVALDVNLSCSGFPYLLPIANGFMAGSDADNFILVTGDTFSRIIAEDDRSTRVLFGDGGQPRCYQGVKKQFGIWVGSSTVRERTLGVSQ